MYILFVRHTYVLNINTLLVFGILAFEHYVICIYSVSFTIKTVYNLLTSKESLQPFSNPALYNPFKTTLWRTVVLCFPVGRNSSSTLVYGVITPKKIMVPVLMQWYVLILLSCNFPIPSVMLYRWRRWRCTETASSLMTIWDLTFVYHLREKKK